jgi:hypothetical protein
VTVYDLTRLLEILDADFAKDDARDGEEHEFGSLWTSWLDAIVAAAKALKDEQGSAPPGFPGLSGHHEKLNDPQVGV